MKTKFNRTLAVLTAVLMLICMLPAGVFAEGEDIPIDAAHFPDANFRECVLNGYYDWNNEEQVLLDTDGSGGLSPEEIAAVTNIDVSNKEIADLAGIEYFTALTELRCYSNKLTSLDVSKNTALTVLWCGYNQLTSLDLSQNTALTELRCYYNKLTSLDVSKNTALTVLWCDGNQLTSLDLSQNTALAYLNCSSNQLTALDVSKNTALTELWCDGNQLTSLDVSKNTALTELICSSNQLTQLDVSKNTALAYLNCSSNQLTQLDVSKNTALTRLYCDYNQLTSLDLSANTNLDNYYNDFHCRSNSYQLPSVPFDLTELPEGFDVSKASDWQGGSVSGNILTFDAADLAVYTYNCGNNHYVEFTLLAPESFTPDPPADGIPIDRVHFPDVNFRRFVLYSSGYDADGSGALSPAEIAAVTYIDVSDMVIADLTGVEYFTALERLNCYNNQLTSLDVTKNTALENLCCVYNQLTSLDLSQNTALTKLECAHNQLAELDVSKNTALTWLNCYNNQLTSLDVTKNTALTKLDCSGNHLTELDVSANTALTKLWCDGNQLTSLDVSNNTALTELYCYENQLTELDVSKNTALEKLYCKDNQLTSLDVSQNTALTYLNCRCNQLTSLDVSKNTALWYLNCTKNQLTSLDLSANTALNNNNFYCESNSYQVSSDPFDLTALPGNFDVSKASNWQGGTVESSILTFNEGSETAAYTYDCGNGLSAKFKLILTETVPGDYDCNGVVNVQDAILTLRAAMELITPSEQSLLNADMDGDGTLAVTDAITILRMAMNLI